MTRGVLITAGLIVGWVGFVYGVAAAFLIADAHINRKYRRNPNGAHEPDETKRWVA